MFANYLSIAKRNKSDEDLAMFFLVTFYLLEQDRQNKIRRMLYFASVAFMARDAEMRIATLRYFANLYGNRQAWVYHRQDNDFDVYFSADLKVSKDLDPYYWQNHYRMSRETFDFICQRVHPFMIKKETNMRATIPVPKRVAVAFWWLASGGSYRSIG